MPVHPFFDPSSTYRLRTASSLWADGGRRSVVGFFAGLCEAQLDQEWIDTPKSPQAWFEGAGAAKANQILHAYLTAQRQTTPPEFVARPARGDARPALASAPPALADTDARTGPVCLVIDVNDAIARVEGEYRGPDSVFTGIGQEFLSSEEPCFRVEIRTRPNRRCLALLLDLPMLSRLGELLGDGGTVAAGGEAALVARAASSEGLRVDPQGDGKKAARARRSQRAWSNVFGLEGVTDARGWFTDAVGVRLPKGLDLRDWFGVVFCVGPEATSLPE
jgi:hypothetical protein